eukprot:jgi/Chrzof1/486/Cz01g17160.t1
MSVQRTVYRHLLRAVRGFHRDEIPLTGVIGLRTVSYLLDPAGYLSQEFKLRREATSIDTALSEAFYGLRTLPQQAAVLKGAEEETTQALAHWSTLQNSLASQQHISSIRAAEAAAWLIYRLTKVQDTMQMVDEDEIRQQQITMEDAIKQAHQQLDSLSNQIRQTHEHLFGKPGLQDLSERTTDQLAAISKHLFGTLRFKYEPVEWVYEGLSPLLLPDVLDRRTGIPLSLALVYAAVAERLGVPVELVCVHDFDMPGIGSGPVHLQDLPPEVAVKQAGRAIAAAPAPNTWLIRAAATPSAPEGAVYVDVTRKGLLMDQTQYMARYGSLGAQQSGSPGSSHTAGSSRVPAAPVVAIWADMVRTLVLAYQRRGESDLVAHYLYQLLALDTNATEWQHALTGGG